MKLKDLTPGYRIAYRHNPKQFYPNSFEITVEGKRLLIVGVTKRHVRKKFRIVGILKPLQ